MKIRSAQRQNVIAKYYDSDRSNGRRVVAKRLNLESRPKAQIGARITEFIPRPWQYFQDF